MSQDLEARITMLQNEVKRLGELVAKFTFNEIAGDVSISVDGPVQGMSIDTGQIGGDVAVTLKDAQGLTMDTGAITGDMSVSANAVTDIKVGSGNVGGDVSIHTGSGNVVVNTGDVAGTAG